MANSNESTCSLDKMESISNPSCSIGASSYSEYTNMSSFQSTSSSLTTFFSMSMSNKKKVIGGEGPSEEDEIEQSKIHKSELVQDLDICDDKVAEVSNMEFFKSLQKHHTCGYLFHIFGDGGIFDGELEVGEKFAEGGQAELYHAHVTWKDPENNSMVQKLGARFVLKVFKKGTFLRDLQKQWPQGMFKAYEERWECLKCRKSGRWRFDCAILRGTILQDGRFAFLMMREREDLRTLIDRKMKERTSLDCGPFPMEMAYKIMYHVARGMDWLHNLNIVHRDLKASNVLCTKLHNNSGNVLSLFHVADFECSIGVVGTGFFRAPEILQALKDKVVNKRPNVFTKAGDVYGYGMVCNEILTGKLPFEGHPLHDYDLVLQGQQLEVPHYVDDWIRDLLHRCWQLDALARPTFQEILEVLEANSKDCIELKRFIEECEALPFEEQLNYKYHW